MSHRVFVAAVKVEHVSPTKSSPSNSSTSDGTAGIVIDDVTHEYQPARGRPVLALDHLNFTIRPREFIALLGPSGCGKSTLLYLIGGFMRIQNGRITVSGQLVTGPGSDRGIVFQHFALYPWKTVRENVLTIYKATASQSERLEIAEQFIQLVGLRGFEGSYPSQLSAA